MRARRTSRRTIFVPATRVAAIVATLGLAASCLPSRAHLNGGDADWVEISYAGDFANVEKLARAHCARFERVPRLIDREEQLARFDCVKP
jgi:hypothetical protein